MAVVKLTSENFGEIIGQHPVVVVDFWAPWCGPCRAFGPIFDRVSDKFPDVVFAKVNTDEEGELGNGLRIRSIPTLVVFREQVMVYFEPGMLPENVLEDLVNQAVALDMAEVHRRIEERESEARSASS